MGTFLTHLQDIQKHADMVELRVDSISGFTIKDVSVIKRSLTVPAIFTCRPTHEGGSYTGTELERRAILQEALDSNFDYVDIELSTIEDHIFPKATKAKRIISYHNFEMTPSYWDLQTLIGSMQSYSPDMIKIATMVKNDQDNQTLYKVITNKLANELRIVVGMGDKGKITRVIAPLLGSFCTYVSEGEKTAKGQLSFHETKTLIDELLSIAS